ncbi:alginate export family protein [Ichthyenterobacterium sp. W332]|uniref:Alginate export family protein n=1 Tax=Microcosmobacter mediterraneus TaxID=3075607 RepID=A0ABU2YL49_9FLAO|nr:alginate export family protein [Ichthyenterobacterium sp. W332]MDT0558856.1 alginate export family protein [Ichthyenterobacterium sp. W332]
MRHIIIIVSIFLITPMLNAQEIELKKKELPIYSLFRATENYEYLKGDNNAFESDVFDPIKFIPLNEKEDIYLSFGGQIRPRFEHYSNRFWEETVDQDFYSQRLAFHTDLHLGKNFRVYTELYHGYTSHEREFVENDEIDIHQAFLQIDIPFQSESSLSFILGRQELAYGSARLVGFREGPNIRRTFDATRAVFKSGKTNIQAFYTREVSPTIFAFDNRFTLFDGDANNPKFWGVYSQFKIKGFNGMNELYYLGFENPFSAFSDVSGKENRHSIGLRRFGQIGKRFTYNTEIIYQFGEINNTTISAFNLEGDWHYKLINTAWLWNPGLKLEYTSGDKNLNDNKLNTFNPMFVNPAYYSLAATITPINLISIHPSVSATPTEKLKLYGEWGIFWRASKNDGLYRPPRFVNRPANGIEDRNLGSQLGFKASYEFNRHLSLDLDMSYFIAGDFQKTSGSGDDIFHFAPTISYKF